MCHNSFEILGPKKALAMLSNIMNGKGAVAFKSVSTGKYLKIVPTYWLGVSYKVYASGLRKSDVMSRFHLHQVNSKTFEIREKLVWVRPTKRFLTLETTG